MRLVFIGTGYVGLVSGTCLAELGHAVTCVDIDAQKIQLLQQGQVSIYEPQLAELVQQNLSAQRLHFTTDLASSVANAEIVFIAVGTPSLANTNSADLSYVFAAAEQVVEHLPADAIVVIKSTVPPGTCRKIAALGCQVVSNPEFLREGAAVQDFMQPDRIVIGADDEGSRGKMLQVYEKINAPVVNTGLETAELIKYTANAFLAMKVAFINEIADICEKVDANINDVALGIGLDQRIGKQFLQPGPGYGGSCFPKDTRALHEFSQTVMAPSQLVGALINANDDRLQNCVRKIIENCRGNVADKTIALLGLAFKANTDDVRDSPAMYVLEKLLTAGAKVRAFDPEAMANAKKQFANVEFCPDIESCIKGSEVIVIATEWPQFKQLDPQKVLTAMKTPVIVDLRNLYAPDHFAQFKIRYVSVGRAVHG